MTKKQELYYLLKAYKRDEYDINTFCDVYLDMFYPDRPVNELSEFELEKFNGLAEIISRYSQYEEEHKLYPNVFSTEKEVRTAIGITYLELIKD